HLFLLSRSDHPRDLPSFPTRRSSDLRAFGHVRSARNTPKVAALGLIVVRRSRRRKRADSSGYFVTVSAASIIGNLGELDSPNGRSEEHTSELQSRENLVCRLLLEKKK